MNYPEQRLNPPDPDDYPVLVIDEPGYYCLEVHAGGPDRIEKEVEIDRVRGAWAYGSDEKGPIRYFIPLVRVIRKGAPEPV